ncbi:hypothetical protein ACJX0J_041513, partial [Zea mays]
VRSIQASKRCNEKEESFKVLKSDFIESRNEVQTLTEEKNKLKEAFDTKSSEFEASTSEKDKRIASLEAELREAGGKFKAESGKLKLAAAEAATASQMKIGDLKDEISHLMQLKENYKILMSNCYTLGNRCQRELERTFTSAGAMCREKCAEGDLEGLMRWILSEIHAYKNVLSTREDYCAWIGARSTASILLKVGCQHIKACSEPDFEVSAENVRRLTAEASEWGRKFLSDIWSKGGKELRKAAEKAASIRKGLQQKKAEGVFSLVSFIIVVCT